MIEYGTIVTILTVITVTIQVFNFWYLSKGDLPKTYVLSSMVYFSYLILETILALHDKAQWSLFLFVGVDAWALVMALIGLYRLYKEKKKNQS